MDSFTSRSLTNKFEYCFKDKGGYPAILKEKSHLKAGEALTIQGPGGELTLLPLEQIHGRIKSLGFRIGNLAYCNDVNEIPVQSLNQLTSLDVFIVDALRYSPHPTHAHLEKTLSWIAAVKPKRAILTNLHVDMDYATLKRQLPEGVEPGFDGVCIDIAI